MKPAKKEKKQSDPCYQKFVDIWHVNFPNTMKFPRDGKHFNSLLKQVEEILKAGNKIVTEESKNITFEFIINWAKKNNHWTIKTPSVGVMDSRIKGIVYEIQTGKKQNQGPPKSSDVFGKYSHL